MNRRVILLGKKGNGKSSTGNSILGDNIFESKRAINAVTLECSVHTREREDGRVFTVCDTPGLFGHGEYPIEMALKIQKSVELCQKPHAFLLVFSAVDRLTTNEMYTIDLLRVIFGDEIFDHCIVVMTRGNLFESKSEFEEFWTGSDVLTKIVESCGNRVVKIENSKNCTSNTGLESLLKMIEELASKGSYDNSFLETHTQVLQEYKQKHGVSNSDDIYKHLFAVLHTLEKRLEQEEKKIEGKKMERKNRRMEEESKRFANLKRETELEEKVLEEKYRRVREESERVAKLKREAELEEKRLEEENRRVEEENTRLAKQKREAEKELQNVSIEKSKFEEIKRIWEEKERKMKEEQRQLNEQRRLLEKEKEERMKTQKTIKTVATVAALTAATGGAGVAALGTAGVAFGAVGAAVVPIAAVIKKFLDK